MNLTRLSFRWIFIIAIPIVLIAATVAVAFNSSWIYEEGYTKFNVGQALGLSPTQLDTSTRELIAYFNNPHQEFLDINVTFNSGVTAPLYDQADIMHMKDVKRLIWLDYGLLLLSVIYVVGYTLVCVKWNKQTGRRELALGAIQGGGLTVGLVCFLGVFAVANFDSFFTIFHKIFFPEGNWQFPPGDNMITLFPEGFWSNVTMVAGLVILTLGLIVCGAGAVFHRTMKDFNRH